MTRRGKYCLVMARKGQDDFIFSQEKGRSSKGTLWLQSVLKQQVKMVGGINIGCVLDKTT